MKFNKLYMALGVAALALASCSDDEEYTPAQQVTTPPAYFNISDNMEIDLEQNSTEISLPIYRAEAGGAFTPELSYEIISGDGTSSVDAFTRLNDENNPIFPDGSTTGAIKYAVDMSKVTPLNDYSFIIKAAGESTPYFMTTAEYKVSYVPWDNMGDSATGLATLVEDGIWQMVGWESGKKGLEMTLDVLVEKHPKKNIFRVTHPYLNAAGAINSATNETFAEYTLDTADPNYLYLNAENPNAVFFCDRSGNIIQSYNTGVRYALEEGGWNEIGNVNLMNMYWFFLNNEWYMVNDTQGISPENGGFDKCIGQFKDGAISFGESAVWFASAEVKEYVWEGKSWVLKLPGAAQIGWASLGEATFTDGFIAQFWGEQNPTYQVAAMENTASQGVFRLQNPYRNGTYPLADSSTDINGEGPWNIVIDCSDPNFVVIEPQATGFSVGTEQIIANPAGYYTTTDDAAKKRTKEQIIADGLNDTYDPATRTITINHPMLSGDNGATWSNVWEVSGFQPAVVVLPEAGAQAASVRSAQVPSGKISLAKSRATNKITRR